MFEFQSMLRRHGADVFKAASSLIAVLLFVSACGPKVEEAPRSCEAGAINSVFEFSGPLRADEQEAILELFEAEVSAQRVGSAGLTRSGDLGGQATEIRSFAECDALLRRIEAAVSGITVSGDCLCEASPAFD
jgi:hypothetical protein